MIVKCLTGKPKSAPGRIKSRKHFVMSAKTPRKNGKNASKIGATVSQNGEATPEKLKTLLAAVFDECQDVDPQLRDRHRRNFVFHMTDWSSDLSRLAELHRHPEQFDKKEAARIVSAFLHHVIPHARAAGRLLLDYEPGDAFKELDSRSG
jgi:hypothetical protein